MSSEVGMDGFIAKPVTIQILRDILGSISVSGVPGV